MAIVPVAKALYLCEEVDVEGGLINLYGLFNRMRAPAFPHIMGEFVAFAQLGGGLGEVSVHVDIRRAAGGRLVRPTAPRLVEFPHRRHLAQLVFRLDGVVIDEPGIYLVELHCDNTWVADVSFEVLEDRP
ncbi:MAG TPA: hypothetical protein VFG68_10675 [Fimbriiglobus sp.]|nr:hypothetical protein [Fimbriiglobus sp.]